MSIEWESNGNGIAQNNAGFSSAWNHTIAGSERYLIIALGLNAFSGNPSLGVISGIDVGGSAATEILTTWVQNGVGFYVAALWGIISPPTGTKTITVTWTANTGPQGPDDLYANSTNYTGVDQTTPTGTAVGASAITSSTPSVNVSSATDELVIDCVYHDTTPTLTVGSGQTQRWQGDPPGNDGTTGHSTEPGASSVTMSWSLSAAEEWAISAVPLKLHIAPTGFKHSQGIIIA